MDERRMVESRVLSGPAHFCSAWLCATLVASLWASGCGSTSSAPTAPTTQPAPEPITSTQFNALVQVVVGPDCTPAERLDPAVPLHYVDPWLAWFGLCESVHPLRTPDGRQLIAGEWLQGSGRLTVSCDNSGTRYDFELQGLVPGGTYSILDRATGAGALSSDSSFQATPTGTAVLSLGGKPGPAVHAPHCVLPFRPETSVHISVYYVEPRQNHSVGHVAFLHNAGRGR